MPRDADPGRVRVDIDGAHVAVIDAFDSLSGIRVHSRSESEIVQFFKDVTVDKGESAGDVVSLFGNVKNFGTIRGDCVAVLGSIEQGDSAVISGDAVSIGGAIRETGTGARVEGQTVSIGFLPFAGFAIPSVPLLLFFGLFAFVLFAGLAGLFGRLFPERLVGMARTISRRTFLSLVLGLLSGPLALMLALLLLVTVIGIPLALLLPLLYALAAFVGYVASAYLLGCKLLRLPLDAKGPMFAPIAAGTGFVTLFYLLGVPLIAFEGGFRMFGFTLLALWIVVGKVCWMLGFGALLLSRLGQDDSAKRGVRRDVCRRPAIRRRIRRRCSVRKHHCRLGEVSQRGPEVWGNSPDFGAVSWASGSLPDRLARPDDSAANPCRFDRYDR